MQAGSKDEAAHLVAPLFEQAMSDLRQRDPERFSARVRELGYLVNVWIAGGAHEGRRPRPVEALEKVLETCEAGMRTQLGAGRATPERGARGAGSGRRLTRCFAADFAPPAEARAQRALQKRARRS